MRAIQFMFLFIGLVILSSSALGQSNEKWYFAFDSSSGQVMGFTADGETNVLMNDVSSVDFARRLDAQTVFATISVTLQFGPVVLTPDDAQILTPTFSPLELYAMTPDENDRRYYPLSYNPPHLVFTNRLHLLEGGPGLLANLDTGEFELLSDSMISTAPMHTRISEDGQWLRYLHLDNEERDRWTLIERSLVDGEERVVYIAPEFATTNADEYGDHWLLAERGDQSGRVVSLLSIDTTKEPVGEINQDNLAFFGLFHNSIYETSLDCTEGCLMTLTPIEGGESRKFTVPASEGVTQPLFEPDDEHLVVFDTSSQRYSLLGTDDEPVSPGYISFQRVITHYTQTWSPDGRYLLVTNAENPTEYGVYDTLERRYVLQESFEDTAVISIIYGEGGFVISENSERHLFYRYADGITVTLPESRGVYFDVLGDGTLLYMQTLESEGRAPGIYRYSPEEDSFTLLVENGQILTP